MIKFSTFRIVLLILVMTFVFDLSAQLVNPNATDAAKKLKHLLDSIQNKKKIISGQAFESVSEKWNEIISDASGGKQPAILSLDFMNSTAWRVENGADPDTTTGMAIDWVKNKGGIIEMHWHWDAPKNTDFSTWQGFYTENTTFDIEYAMNNTNSEEYTLLIRDMDVVATYLKKMQDAGIALLWRPLHEAEGGWFWWGAKGGDACKTLYRLMYDRFVNIHGLNNLIWVWNSYGTTRENWYPGDDVVDIIAWDYPDYNENSGSWSQYEELFGSKNKLWALGEDGKLTDPNILSSQPWAYFITWAYMIQDPSINNGKNTAEWINQVYNDPRVITLDDLIPGPKAKAGSSQIIFDHDGDGLERVKLDGSASFTNSGEIISYTWYLDDTEIASGISPEVSLALGINNIRLTIKTNLGEESSAQVIIEVKTPSLSLNKQITASSTEADFGNIAENAIDGNVNTRWSSLYADPQYYQIDLGKRYDISKIIILWETAAAKEYRIEQSNDGTNWTTVLTKSNMPNGPRNDTISNLKGGARYVRMFGTARTSEWGYSIYEFEVYGTENPTAEPVSETLSFFNLKKNGELKVFPTKIKRGGYLNIQTNQNINSIIRIYNMQGNEVFSKEINSTQQKIKIDSQLKSGLYIINLESAHSIKTNKFIVE